MTITTIGRWIDLPTSGGGSDRLALDQPGGAGLLQIAASNACLAARENGLRPVWEDFGSSDVHANLLIANNPLGFWWRGEDSDGVYARFAGTFRVRLFGETATAPRLHLAARALAPSGYETGIILAVSRGAAWPEMLSTLYGTATTSSTSLVDLSVTLPIGPELLTPEPTSLQSEGAAVTEAGLHTVLGVWVGAWCTSGDGASKGAVYGPTVLLREP